MTQPKWQFASRFRRHAFGWRSDTPILRIKEAVAEIKAVAKRDPELAAEGAIKLLEKLSPALEQVDSSSGAVGTAVNRAIDILVPIIASAQVDRRTRNAWLRRLWDAFQDDQLSYLLGVADHWGGLCVAQELASAWADELLPLLYQAWSPEAPTCSYFTGTNVCLSCLAAAGRHDELLALLDHAPYNSWSQRVWGVRALVAMGKEVEALQYAEASRGINAPLAEIDRACEEILLSSGLADEAYRRYALTANTGKTNLATFRAIAKKYPHKAQADILRDLVASQPGSAGKWFAAAKDAGLYDVALELAAVSPPDHRTLVRAARDFGATRPDVAVACGLTALRWIALGHGYEVTGLEILDAYSYVMQAVPGAGIDEQVVHLQISAMANGERPGSRLLRAVLGK